MIADKTFAERQLRIKGEHLSERVCVEARIRLLESKIGRYPTKQLEAHLDHTQQSLGDDYRDSVDDSIGSGGDGRGPTGSLTTIPFRCLISAIVLFLLPSPLCNFYLASKEKRCCRLGEYLCTTLVYIAKSESTNLNDFQVSKRYFAELSDFYTKALPSCGRGNDDTAPVQGRRTQNTTHTWSTTPTSPVSLP